MEAGAQRKARPAAMAEETGETEAEEWVMERGFGLLGRVREAEKADGEVGGDGDGV